MGIKSGRHTRRYRERLEFLCNQQLLGIEYQYILDIVSSKENTLSPAELLELPFYELENVKMMYDLLSRGNLASQLDNQPKQEG